MTDAVISGIKNNKRIVPPDLCTLLDYTEYRVKKDLNCISIGTIQTFYPNEQTADIQLNYKIWQGENKAPIEYPLLIKCPIIILNGGGGFLTFPIESGDSCIVLFCDREIDTWFTSGGTNAPQTARVHDLNDGIALIGAKNTGNFIQNYNMLGPEIRAPGVYATGNLIVSTGATGSFVAKSGETIIVNNGIITEIIPA